jgi:hypothetical protein
VGLVSIASAGIDGECAVFVQAFGAVSAVCSEVGLDEFCHETAEARLGDLAWIGPRVLRHEKVIEEAMLHGPVLPAPFATLFTSAESLGSLIAGQREAITRFFDTLGAAREWSVKGSLDREKARERILAQRKLPPASSPGARYLQQKRLGAEADREVGPWLTTSCRHAVARLQECASAFRERPVRISAATAGAEVVADWAFLVAPEAESAFAGRLQSLVEEVEDSGLRYSLSGPWPAYSFAPALPRSTE